MRIESIMYDFLLVFYSDLRSRWETLSTYKPSKSADRNPQEEQCRARSIRSAAVARRN